MHCLRRLNTARASSGADKVCSALRRLDMVERSDCSTRLFYQVAVVQTPFWESMPGKRISAFFIAKLGVRSDMELLSNAFDACKFRRLQVSGLLFAFPCSRIDVPSFSFSSLGADIDESSTCYPSIESWLSNRNGCQRRCLHNIFEFHDWSFISEQCWPASCAASTNRGRPL